MTKRPKGFFTGAEADARAGKASMSPGTHHGGGGRGGAPGTSTKATHVPTTKRTVEPRDHTGKVISALGYATNINPIKALGTAMTWGKSLFAKTPEQKRASYTKKGLDITNPAEMHGYQTKYGKIDEDTYTGGEGIGNITTHTQSLVTAPTADKGAGFGHQWNFQAYGNQTQTAANPYDYTKAPYAKKGKMIRTYATGQEIKNFSKGKRFGPPPLKGPNPQGLQVILENSDYFKKLIG
jgi:hypothetical protein